MEDDPQSVRNVIILTLGAVGGFGVMITSIENDPAWIVLNTAMGALIWMGIGAVIGWIVDKLRGVKSVTATQPTAPTAPPDMAPSSDRRDIAEALRQVKELHEEGILTDEEYETKRKGLADQL